MVSVDRPHDPWPGFLKGDESLGLALQFFAVVVENHRNDAEEGTTSGPGLQHRGPRQWSQYMAAGLSLKTKE